MGLHEGGQRRAAGRRRSLLRGQPARAAFLFGDVAELMRGGQVAFKQLDQVVRETKQVRLHLLGHGGARPSAFSAESVFEFVEDFFEIPAPQVEECDHAGRQGKFAGEELIFFAGGGMGRADPPQGDAGDGRDELSAVIPALFGSV